MTGGDTLRQEKKYGGNTRRLRKKKKQSELTNQEKANNVRGGRRLNVEHVKSIKGEATGDQTQMENLHIQEELLILQTRSTIGTSQKQQTDSQSKKTVEKTKPSMGSKI